MKTNPTAQKVTSIRLTEAQKKFLGKDRSAKIKALINKDMKPKKTHDEIFTYLFNNFDIVPLASDIHDLQNFLNS